MNAHPWFYRLSLVATAMALCVVVLGAWVRLTDAGLGCPDWPGCYGQWDVPNTDEAIAAANQAFPDTPVDIGKGWREMVHRYLASMLGLLIVGLGVFAWRQRHRPGQPWRVPLLLVALVCFQGVLGAWTVTWQLKPAVVTAHLLGGLTTLSLLWWVTLRSNQMGGGGRLSRVPGLGAFLAIGTLVAVAQISLGGWTSTNYAALACNDFPACSLGEYWPEEADFAEGFVLWRGLGVNYEFGVLDHPARMAIHLVHRVGAIVVTLVLGGLAFWLWRAGGLGRTMGMAVAGALALQVLIGIGNVIYNLPLALAVAHNAGAALLMLVLVTVFHVRQPVARP
ncbi:COX15/CtaA family protein [Spiribacter vilamensis]|uniref:Cytochrome c oxidase assembly protein subunit 15 n=1 Tax=Spiribacter vilamensis TaxID=531306 RepID=A0A4Q8D1M1_9GAMM|nr:COX15/CtaA family protein [Spiribacter vilamensis]RZU99238.1 cytochrome c oxidase assembly protein subunit 15 [Spiribacter vilamensis]TVO61775.1 heme A synthase [Spiribacter vilamensis]